jgi:hypothetical protein
MNVTSAFAMESLSGIALPQSANTRETRARPKGGRFCRPAPSRSLTQVNEEACYVERLNKVSAIALEELGVVFSEIGNGL